MTVFRDYEIAVLEHLTDGILSRAVRVRLHSEARLISCNYSGSGYLLTVRHDDLPLERTVCDHPSVTGTVNGLHTGFVVFLQDHELTLECHTYGEALPDGFRDMDVSIVRSEPE